MYLNVASLAILFVVVVVAVVVGGGVLSDEAGLCLAKHSRSKQIRMQAILTFKR